MEIAGAVSRISADITTEQRNGQSGPRYYTIRIITQENEIARLGGVRLILGMPVEEFVQTGERKVLSYLVKPLHDQIMRAFSERWRRRVRARQAHWPRKLKFETGWNQAQSQGFTEARTDSGTGR